jgi:transcriptional regulator with XRE-family HTH domain
MSNGRDLDIAEVLRSAAVEAAARQGVIGDAATIGRRIRAALALAGKASSDVAPELNISTRTLDRTIAGERLPREWELRRLADLLPVPAWFLLGGFEGLPTVDDPTAAALTEIRALDRKIDVEVVPRLDRLAEERRERERSSA